MDVFKEQILKCVSEHQPITTLRLQQITGEPKGRISAMLGQLRNLGLVFTKAAIGHFHGECGYENWLITGDVNICPAAVATVQCAATNPGPEAV